MLFDGLSYIKDRLLFLIFFVVIYRLGSHIPLPFIKIEILQGVFQQESIWSIFNIFAGGNLSRMTIFALGVMPYISASIIMQLLAIVVPAIDSLRKESSESGAACINQYTRYLTVLICLVQGIALTLILENLDAILVNGNSLLFLRTLIISTLIGGTIFLMWLGEKVNIYGVGEGISLIIFVGIISELPASISSLINLYQIQAISSELVLFSIFLALFLIVFVVFMESSYHIVPIQYPKNQAMNMAGKSSYLPIKINIAGAIPAIFASSLLLTLVTIVNAYANYTDSLWFISFSVFFNRGSLLYLLCYVLSIVFFCFFYTAVVFNTESTANNLKQYGGFIAGIRPGEQTAQYLDKIVTYVTVIGSLYVSVICIVPELFLSKFGVPFFFLSGTAILIVINVIMDTINQIQSYIYSYQYESLFKKVKVLRKK